MISGNVSLYNETMDEPIYPTPVAGRSVFWKTCPSPAGWSSRSRGTKWLVLGTPPSADGLAGSEYLEVMHGTVAGKTIDKLEH